MVWEDEMSDEDICLLVGIEVIAFDYFCVSFLFSISFVVGAW